MMNLQTKVSKRYHTTTKHDEHVYRGWQQQWDAHVDATNTDAAINRTSNQCCIGG